MKITACIVALALVAGPLSAQTHTVPDSLEAAGHGFNAKGLIVPGTLIAVGAAGAIGLYKGLDRSVTRNISGERRLRSADYLQFVPRVMSLGLGLTGVRTEYTMGSRLWMSATSMALNEAMIQGLKWTVHRRRPNGREHSFPSGHAARAFGGAESMRIIYGNAWGALGYGVAVATGIMRVASRSHWLSDVVAGAGIGILSARAAYWLLPLERKIFDPDKFLHMAVVPSALPGGAGMCLVAQF